MMESLSTWEVYEKRLRSPIDIQPGIDECGMKKYCRVVSEATTMLNAPQKESFRKHAICGAFYYLMGVRRNFSDFDAMKTALGEVLTRAGHSSEYPCVLPVSCVMIADKMCNIDAIDVNDAVCMTGASAASIRFTESWVLNQIKFKLIVAVPSQFIMELIEFPGDDFTETGASGDLSMNTGKMNDEDMRLIVNLCKCCFQGS